MTIIDGAKVTQTGHAGFGGHNVLGRFFINSVEVFPSANVTPVTQAAHGFSDGQIVYRASGSYALADANSAGNPNAIGIVANAATDKFNLVTSGLIGISGLTDGANYYLSKTLGAFITSELPSPDFVVPIFTAISTSEAIVNIQLGLIGA